MTDDTRTDLLAACGEAIEGLGRLRSAVHNVGDGDTGAYRYDLIAMVDVAYRMLGQIEQAINVNSIRES